MPNINRVSVHIQLKNRLYQANRQAPTLLQDQSRYVQKLCYVGLSE